MQLLERIVDVGGVLLRAERVPVPGAQGSARAGAFLLTFDVGRILVGAEPEGDGLQFLHLEVGDEPPGSRELADEEEPWWRVLGSPLARATEDAARGVVALQFRKDGDNPRVLTLARAGEVVAVGLDPVA